MKGTAKGNAGKSDGTEMAVGMRIGGGMGIAVGIEMTTATAAAGIAFK
jgi:hypothetical protein